MTQFVPRCRGCGKPMNTLCPECHAPCFPVTPAPVAWRKPVEPQYDYADRYRYREEHGIGAPEGWEPLYTEPRSDSTVEFTSALIADDAAAVMLIGTQVRELLREGKAVFVKTYSAHNTGSGQ